MVIPGQPHLPDQPPRSPSDNIGTMPHHHGNTRRRPREIHVPPPKVHQVVSEMHQALGTKQRFTVLHHIKELVAADISLARWLVEGGAWDGLLLQLRFALNRHGTSFQEVDEICNVANLLLTTCPPEAQQQGVSIDHESMGLLVRAFHWSAGARYSVVSVWYVASASAAGSEMLLRNRQFLACLGDFFKQSVSQHNGNMGNVLGILKNTTYFVENAWDFLSETPDIMSSLVHSSCAHGQEPKQTERMSAIWRNLAVIQENRRRLADNPSVLNALHFLAWNQLQENSSGRFVTIRNILSTLLSLSMDGEACWALLMHGDGLFASLIENLLDGCPDETARKRAARTVRLWASHKSSGCLLVHCHALMDRVSSTAIQDSCQDVRQEAAEAFGRCAGLSWPLPQQRAVMDALASLCGQSSSSANVVARALKGQASIASNRLLLMERPIFLDSLVAIALEDHYTNIAREDACCALADLALEQKNRRAMASTKLFEALCVNMTAPNRRDYAVRALVHLADEEENVPKMVHFPTLLQSLIQYAATAEDPIKGPVKQAILQLVTEI